MRMSRLLAVASLLLTETVWAAGGRFAIAPPPLGHPTYRAGQVQHRIGLGYQSYRSGATDMSGPHFMYQQRRAYSDRWALNAGLFADHVSGTDQIMDDPAQPDTDDDITLWQTFVHATAEYQFRFTERWNAIVFAGPRLGYGEYAVDYTDETTGAAEELDAANRIAGGVAGVQTSLPVSGLRLTPFLSYEELEAEHESTDSTTPGTETSRHTYQVTSYGADLLFPRSGITLSALIQDLEVGPVTDSYELFLVSFQF